MFIALHIKTTYTNATQVVPGCRWTLETISLKSLPNDMHWSFPGKKSMQVPCRSLAVQNSTAGASAPLCRTKVNDVHRCESEQVLTLMNPFPGLFTVWCGADFTLLVRAEIVMTNRAVAENILPCREREIERKSSSVRKKERSISFYGRRSLETPKLYTKQKGLGNSPAALILSNCDYYPSSRVAERAQNTTKAAHVLHPSLYWASHWIIGLLLVPSIGREGNWARCHLLPSGPQAEISLEQCITPTSLTK